MATKKRLIDADELKRQILAFATAIKREFLSIKAIIDRIDISPTVDAVEVIHYKDCKHYGGVTFGFRCKKWSTPMAGTTQFTRPEDFCSYGERRTE